MKEKGKKNLRVKLAEKATVKIAEIYSGFICLGRWYEPKIPKKLQK